MVLHKIRPRLKNYSKNNFFLNFIPQIKGPLSKKKNIKLFSPSINYLNSHWVDKLSQLFKNNLEERKKLKLFFGFYRTSLFKKILKTELKKKSKLRFSIKELELCSILERRLDILLFRLGFVPTIFAAKQLIAHKKVKVNNYANSSFSRLLKKGDIISFDSSIYQTIQYCLKTKLKNDNFYLNNSNQMEVNFKTLKIVILTTKLNIFSQTQYYKFLLK